MHGIIALTSAVLLCLSAHAEGLHSKDGCTAFNESVLTQIVSATSPEAQISLAASIIADILPSIGPHGLVTIGVNITGEVPPISSPDSILRNIYTFLANQFDQRITEGGYRQFLMAMNEISVAKEEACRNASGIVSEWLQLIQEFVDAYKMKEQSVQIGRQIRSLYGKLLCLNSTFNSNSSRKRRALYDDECICPPDGFDSDFTFCHFCDFYACLTYNVTKHIIFGIGEHIVDQCLAFVIDTTGSMSQEIDTAKDIILKFVKSEEDIGQYGCYILVPFNDVGPHYEIVHIESVGPVIYADSRSARHLSNFYQSVESNVRLGWINNRHSFGGDGPEYALYAMLQALRAKDDEGFDLMIRGSQMVVLTDAPSKQPDLKDNVTHHASTEGICIHFFVNHPDYSLEDGIYQEIANKTHGTLISHFTQWDIANFFAKFEENDGCYFLHSRKKRSSESFLSSCKYTTVSRLAANLRLSIKAPTGSYLMITQPNGTIHEITVLHNNLAFFNYTYPGHGSWSVCSADGYSIEVTFVTTYRIDTTVFYWNSDITTLTPPACTAGKIMIITSKHSSIRSASVDIVQGQRGQSENKTNKFRVNLTKGCDGALVSDVVNFPSGSFTYHLVGTDIDDVPFKYNTRRKVTYRQPDVGEFLFNGISKLDDDAEEVSFEPIINSAEMDTDEITKFEYDFTNRGAYDTNIDFFVNTPEGLASNIEPSSLLVAAGATIKLSVFLRVTDCPIKQSILHTVNVTAQVSCTEQQIQAPIRSVTYRQPDNGEFSFKPIGSFALEMDRDEILKLEYNFTNVGAYNKTFNFSVNAPEGVATRIDPSSLLVVAHTTVKLQVLVRVINSSIKRGTLHSVNVTSTVCTGQHIQAPTRWVLIRELPDYNKDCDDCIGVCLKITYLGGNFKRCHGSLDNLPSPMCPPGMGQSNQLKMVYFMEGAQLATFDPLPACTFGRVGLTLSNTTNVKLLSASVGHSHHRYNLAMEEFCKGSYLVPAGSIGNFPNGEITYYFEFKYKSDLSASFIRSRRVVFTNQISEIKLELYSSESGPAEIGTSKSTKISFRLSNPTFFATSFTLSGSFQNASGLQVDNLVDSVVVYPQEMVEIEATIKASIAPAGSRNVFTLNATNDCLDLSAHRNITVVEQTTGDPVTQTEAPTPSDECGGCQNGGTCTVRVRRGRVILRCRCPPNFGGSYCQIAY